MSQELILLQSLDNVAATIPRGKAHSWRQRNNSHQIAALKWTPHGSSYLDQIIRQAHRDTVPGPFGQIYSYPKDHNNETLEIAEVANNSRLIE